MSVMTAGERVPTQFRAELSADTDPATGWRVVDDDGLLCMYCSQREAEMIAEACNNYHALQQRAAGLEADRNERIEQAQAAANRADDAERCIAALEAREKGLIFALQMIVELPPGSAGGYRKFAQAQNIARAALAAGGTKP